MVGFIVILASAAVTQEQEEDTPGYQRTLRLENQHVRVIEYQYEPGGSSPVHTHEFPRVVYVMEGGSLELLGAEGSVARLNVRPGQTLWRPAQTHVVRNPGRRRVRVLELEVKAAGG